MTKYLFPAREPFNAYSHLIGAIAAVIFTIFLMVKTSTYHVPFYLRLFFLIYGITVFLMFASSAIYHMVNVSQKKELFLRKLDHIMIYLVIAGSYTPVCAITLTGAWKISMLIGIWVFALFGFFSKIFWMNAPRWLSTILYLIMGWVAIILLPQMWNAVPKGFLIWLAIGGIFYTIGAIIYGTKKPNPYPEYFGFHEIWHLFVMAGAFSHFWAIYYYLPGLELTQLTYETLCNSCFITII